MGHTDMVTGIAVTPDEQRIVTGSVDGTVRLWDADNGRELLTLNPHTGPIWSVAVTPDGQTLVAGAHDGVVTIWEAASDQETTTWARQDREVERRQAAWTGAKAPGFIRDWLVLGPLAQRHDYSGAKALQRQPLSEEAKLRPRAGDHVWEGGQDFRWQEFHWDESVLEFNRFLRKLDSDRLAYAVCYVNSAAERHDLLLQVGSNSHVKVYLNGQEVYRYIRNTGGLNLDPVGPLTLHKGTNVFVVKMVNAVGGWLFCARFVDQQCHPAKDIQVRPTPE
jgi:WD40 repeat protein